MANTKAITEALTKDMLLDLIPRLDPTIRATKTMTLTKLQELLAQAQKSAAQRIRQEALDQLVPCNLDTPTQRLTLDGYQFVNDMVWSLANQMNYFRRAAEDLVQIRAYAEYYKAMKEALGKPFPLTDEARSSLRTVGVSDVVTQADVDWVHSRMLAVISGANPPDGKSFDVYKLKGEIERQDKARGNREVASFPPLAQKKA